MSKTQSPILILEYQPSSQTSNLFFMWLVSQKSYTPLGKVQQFLEFFWTLLNSSCHSITFWTVSSSLTYSERLNTGVVYVLSVCDVICGWPKTIFYLECDSCHESESFVEVLEDQLAVDGITSLDHGPSFGRFTLVLSSSWYWQLDVVNPI